MVHLPLHLARFGLLPTCWVTERKHRVAKRYGGDVKNLRRYDRTVIGEFVCHNLAFLAVDDVFDTSVGLKRPCKLNKRLCDFVQNEFGEHALEIISAVTRPAWSMEDPAAEEMWF